MFTVYYKTLDAVDATNKFILLDGTAIPPWNVALDTIGGTAQSTDGDFAADATSIRWDSPSYNLYSQLSESDKIRVIYDKSSI